MQGRGKALYNKNLVSEKALKDSLAKERPDLKLTAEEEENLLENLNDYVETTFDKLCDETPMYFGVWPFSAVS
jgi:hypothetical protein